MKTLKEIVYRIALHEAGHWVVWYLMGGKSSGIEIQIFEVNGRHTGGMLPLLDWQIDSLDDASEYAKARTISLLAGAYASGYDGTSFNAKKINHDLSDSGGAKNDFYKAIDNLYLYCNINKKLHLTSDIADGFADIASDFIIDNYDVITEIANEFSHMAKLEGELLHLNQEQLISIFNKKKGLNNE
ncbi:hypothetical protein [Providencia rettgeri]|uniref:hypothetical protein n=1 Tax=Providencia rettgeri TaxID=587 RepID=UPI0023609852|nr:hypothetical protein [Providencia rettgeri]